MDINLLSSINNLTNNTALRNAVEEMEDTFRYVGSLGIASNPTNEELIELLSAKSYTALIKGFLDYVSQKFQEYVNFYIEQYFNAELTMSRTSGSFAEVTQNKLIAQHHLLVWKDRRDNIDELIRNLQEIEKGAYIENKILIALGKSVQNFLNKILAERGLNGSVRLSMLQEMTGYSRTSISEHLYHYGLITEDSEIDDLNWDSRIFNFIRYLRELNKFSDSERKDFISKNSVIYRKIRQIRADKDIVSRAEISNFTDYYITLDDIFEVLKKLNLVRATSSNLAFKRKFKLDYTMWQKLYRSDVAVDGSDQREVLFFTIEGALNIINWMNGSVEYKLVDVTPLFPKEVNPAQRHISLEKANIRLARTLQKDMVLMNMDSANSDPVSQPAVEFLNALTHIKTQVSDRVILTDEVNEKFENGYRIDQNEADAIILEFLSKLIFNTDVDFDQLANEYIMHPVFYNLIQVYSLSLELDEEDYQEQLSKNPENLPERVNLRQGNFKRVFRELYPVEFEKLLWGNES